MNRNVLFALVLLLAGITAKAQTTEYAKTDFVPGDEIFFDDDFANEKLGEFASHWDLIGGYAEVASVEGRKVLAFTDDGVGTVIPLMKDKLAFLPDIFTVEYDLYLSPIKSEDPDAWQSAIDMGLLFGKKNLDYDIDGEQGSVWFRYREDGSSNISWSIGKPGGDSANGEKNLGLSEDLSDYNPKDNPLQQAGVQGLHQRDAHHQYPGCRGAGLPDAAQQQQIPFQRHLQLPYGQGRRSAVRPPGL